MLQKRVSELESTNKEEKISNGPQFTTNCLLLGDTNVQQVLQSDLTNICSVRTITGGYIEKIMGFCYPQSFPYPLGMCAVLWIV